MGFPRPWKSMQTNPMDSLTQGIPLVTKRALSLKLIAVGELHFMHPTSFGWATYRSRLQLGHP